MRCQWRLETFVGERSTGKVRKGELIRKLNPQDSSRYRIKLWINLTASGGKSTFGFIQSPFATFSNIGLFHFELSASLSFHFSWHFSCRHLFHAGISNLRPSSSLFTTTLTTRARGTIKITNNTTIWLKHVRGKKLQEIYYK